jgi:hypothetical protein
VSIVEGTGAEKAAAAENERHRVVVMLHSLDALQCRMWREQQRQRIKGCVTFALPV